jgi:hypothetical protein
VHGDENETLANGSRTFSMHDVEPNVNEMLRLWTAHFRRPVTLCDLERMAKSKIKTSRRAWCNSPTPTTLAALRYYQEALNVINAEKWLRVARRVALPRIPKVFHERRNDITDDRTTHYG